MSAYRIPNHDTNLLRGADAGQRRKDLHDRIADDYDAMHDVYVDTATHLVEYEDMPAVLRALDRAEYALQQLRDGKTSLDDPDTRRLYRELVRQAELVRRRVTATIDEHVEAAL